MVLFKCLLNVKTSNRKKYCIFKNIRTETEQKKTLYIFYIKIFFRFIYFFTQIMIGA